MWEETFEAYLGTLLQKPSNQLFTREKTERIINFLMNGKTDSDISCLWALIFPLSEIIRPCFPHASRKNHTVMMFNSTKHSNTNNFSTSLQLPGIRKTNDWREYTVCASHIKNYIPFRGICVHLHLCRFVGMSCLIFSFLYSLS